MLHLISFHFEGNERLYSTFPLFYTLPGQSLPHLDGQERKLLFGLSTGCQQDLEV